MKLVTFRTRTHTHTNLLSRIVSTFQRVYTPLVPCGVTVKRFRYISSTRLKFKHLDNGRRDVSTVFAAINHFFSLHLTGFHYTSSKLIFNITSTIKGSRMEQLRVTTKPRVVRCTIDPAEFAENGK